MSDYAFHKLGKDRYKGEVLKIARRPHPNAYVVSQGLDVSLLHYPF